MADSAEPEIIFSDLTQDVLIDGHRFSVEIYRTSIFPWLGAVGHEQVRHPDDFG